MSGLSHLDERGQARMVDVSDKPATERRATAEAELVMAAETLALIVAGAAPKGDVAAVARLAGIMAAKRTAELIPLCHVLPLSSVAVEITPAPSLPGLRIAATACTHASTGVEMEALTAAAIAALAVYDMVKAVDRGLRVQNLRLTAKSGGRSGEFRQP